MSRRRIVEIRPAVLTFLLRGRRDTAITSDWPEDAEVVGCYWDYTKGLMRWVVESETFDEVPVGDTALDWAPKFTAHLVEPSAMLVMDMLQKMADEMAVEALHPKIPSV